MKMISSLNALLVFVSSWTMTSAACSDDALATGLMIPAGGRSGRIALPADEVEHLRVHQLWKSPKSGAAVSDVDSRRWQPIQANEEGWIQHRGLRGGYVHWRLRQDRASIRILEAQGHAVAFINGQPRAGDPYQMGWHQLPVALKEGENELLFQVARGRLQVRLSEPRAPITLSQRDTTLPDLLEGDKQTVWCAVMLINATDKPLDKLSIVSESSDGVILRIPIADQLPLSCRKIPFQVGVKTAGEREEETFDVRLIHNDNPASPLDRIQVKLRVKKPGQTQRRTFISRMDGSVQYYAIRTAADTSTDKRPGLLLTLHGAGVEGHRQASVYGRKDDLHIVAPTNRRPFGFDWEDWGRGDAMEVLELAKQEWPTDPARVYLSGHSMGGHGTWHLGVTFPGQFAAIAPSAGWVSFWTYAGGPRKPPALPRDELLTRAGNASDTLKLVENLAATGIYILHGDADDNVPVSQARIMRQRLAAFHPDFVYKEQPGAGHWWGDQCCDWPPLIDFVRQHRLPETKTVERVSFRTANPSISHQHHWASIEMQTRPLLISSVDLRLRSDGNPRVIGKTDNVSLLRLELPHLVGRRLQVDLDQQRQNELTVPESGDVYFQRRQDTWSAATKPLPALKGPHRYGPFKQVFDRRVLLVYGTRGQPEENAWALNKARFDAETFWYRGNGAFEVIADSDFDGLQMKDRNIVLYGNADTNAAWERVLLNSAIQPKRSRIDLGNLSLRGDDLGFYFIQPRRGSQNHLVGVVGGTGLAGMRSVSRSRYFVSGVGYPDFLIHRSNRFRVRRDSIEAVGLFDERWQVSPVDAYFKKITVSE